MTAAEEGVLLLCCQLGDAESKPLTVRQFQELGLRVRAHGLSGDSLRDLNHNDLMALGYSEPQALQFLQLLDRERFLQHYLRKGEAMGIIPLTRLSPQYPHRIRHHMGLAAPPVLFCRGDLRLLSEPSLAVVGSRRLHPENANFARQAGRLAAREGRILISGGATGADRVAQFASEEAGGGCAIFVADQLTRYSSVRQTLYLSADGYDLPFSTPRAFHRNKLIHMQGDRVLAVQCTYGSGGTWQGCTENLKHGWSELFVFADGSQGAAALVERGAVAITQPEQIHSHSQSQLTLF